MSTTIFLSHASDDWEAADILAKELLRTGLDVWSDTLPSKINPGDTWIGTLERALQESQAYLILVGSRGVNKWVRFEADYALNRHAQYPDYRIVPVLMSAVKSADLPPFLQRFQAISLPENFREIGADFFNQLSQQIRLGQEQPLETQECPFPGLEAFDESQARFFFGRDAEIREICDSLGQRRWLQIEGTSGAGKSSMARAGLVPAFHRQWIHGGAVPYWSVAIMRPRNDPVFELASALTKTLRAEGQTVEIDKVHKNFTEAEPENALRYLLAQYPLPDRHGLLLVVDQLEETFTLAETDKARRFDAILSAALKDAASPLYLITTIRSDSLERFKELPGLSNAVNNKAVRYYLKPMGKDALGEAVIGPARVTGLIWQDGLHQQIIEDALATPGSLPLLGFILRQLFKRREGNTLTWHAYQDLKGLDGAVAAAADDLWESLGEQQSVARALLLSLVKPGRGLEDNRRTLKRAEALEAAGGGPEAEEVLLRLSGQPAPNAPPVADAPIRLIVSDQEHVDIIHEVILKSWGRLRSWIEAERPNLERRDDLEAAARSWEAAGRAEGGLPKGGQLAYYQQAEKNSSDLAQEFLREADLYQKKEAQRQLRQRRQNRRILAGAGLVLLLLLGFIGFYWYMSWREKHYQMAESHLAQGNILASHQRWQEAISYYNQSSALYTKLGLSTLPADLKIWEAYSHAPPPLMFLRGHKGEVRGVAFYPDGEHGLTGSVDGTLKRWELNTGRILNSVQTKQGNIYGVAISPDGSKVLSAGKDSTIQLWDGNTLEFRGLFGDPSQDRGAVWNVVFSPDGKRIASAHENHMIKLWDVETRQLIKKFDEHQTKAIESVDISPDGNRLLSGGDDNQVVLWDIGTGRIIRTFDAEHKGIVLSVAFSPDGRQAASAGDDDQLILWNVETGKSIKKFTDHREDVNSLAFSKDGHYLVSGSTDQSVILWDLDNQTIVQHFYLSSPVMSVAISPDRSLILAGAGDNSASLWTPGHFGQMLLTGHTGNVIQVDYSSDGRLALSGGESGAKVWDVSKGQLKTNLNTTGVINAVAFVPGTTQALTGSTDQSLILWNAETGEKLYSFPEVNLPVVAMAVSRDGKRLVAAGGRQEQDAEGRKLVDWQWWVWDLPTRQFLGSSPKGNADRINNLAFCSNNTRVLSSWNDGKVRVLDLERFKESQAWQLDPKAVIFVACSPDGSIGASAGSDSYIKLWNAKTGQLIGDPLAGHQLAVISLAFTPDGSLLVSGGEDGTLQIRDVATGRELFSFTNFTLKNEKEQVYSVATSPTANAVLLSGEKGSVKILNLSQVAQYRDFASRLAAAQERLARNPQDAFARQTLAEWYQFRGLSNWASSVKQGNR